MPFGRPFRAISLCVSFPGLKPRLFSVRPSGAWNSHKKMSKLQGVNRGLNPGLS